MQGTFAERVSEADDHQPGTADPSNDVELVIPASHSHVRLARLAASGIGALTGADVDRIEELRLLVDEACALLLECSLPRGGGDDRLHVTFRPAAPLLEIVVERRGAALVDRPSPTSVAVLDAISAHWAVRGDTVVVVADLGDVDLAEDLGADDLDDLTDDEVDDREGSTDG